MMTFSTFSACYKDSRLEHLPERPFEFDDKFAVSAKHKVGVEPLKERLRELLDEYEERRREEQTENALSQLSDVIQSGHVERRGHSLR